MTETERNELLVALDVNMKNMCKRMEGVEKELKKRQCLLHSKQLKDLEDEFDPKLCVVHSQKLSLIMWLGVIIAGSSLVTLIKVFWVHIFPAVLPT